MRDTVDLVIQSSSCGCFLYLLVVETHYAQVTQSNPCCFIHIQFSQQVVWISTQPVGIWNHTHPSFVKKPLCVWKNAPRKKMKKKGTRRICSLAQKRKTQPRQNLRIRGTNVSSMCNDRFNTWISSTLIIQTGPKVKTPSRLQSSQISGVKTHQVIWNRQPGLFVRKNTYTNPS